MKGTDVFCTDKIRSSIFFSTKHMIAAYDIAPVLPGHSMIIPKRHVARIIELTKPEADDLMEVLRRVIPVLLRIYGDSSKSYVLVMQSGPHAGGTVTDHMHMHIIPRRRDDRYSRQGESPAIYIEKVKRVSKAEHDRQVRRLRKEFPDSLPI